MDTRTVFKKCHSVYPPKYHHPRPPPPAPPPPQKGEKKKEDILIPTSSVYKQECVRIAAFALRQRKERTRHIQDRPCNAEHERSARHVCSLAQAVGTTWLSPAHVLVSAISVLSPLNRTSSQYLFLMSRFGLPVRALGW